MKTKPLFLVAIALFMAQCTDPGADDSEKKPEPKPEPAVAVIKLDNTSTLFTLPEIATGTAELSFECNYDWTISTSDTRAVPSWFEVSPKSGGDDENEEVENYTVTISLTEANDTYEDRSAYIKIVCDDVERLVTVTQKKNNALLVTNDRYEVDMKGEVIEVEVKANVSYNVSIKNNWIHRTTAPSSTTRALKESKLYFAVDESREPVQRQGQIVLSSGDMSETIDIFQAGEEVLVLSKTECDVSKNGEKVRIDVRANTEYAVEMPEVEWIERTSETSVTSLHFNVKANDSNADREAKIVFRTATKREEVVVRQSANDAILVEPTTYNFDETGGELKLEIQHNVDLQVNIETAARSWITQAQTHQTRAMESRSLRFNIAPNTTANTRTGKITILGGEARQDITVTQTPRESPLTYISSDYSADGRVTLLQQATEGNGINIVLLGDAFSDRLVADGTYDETMRTGLEHFFSEEPYKSFRRLFTVHYVTTVSRKEVYTSSRNDTALGVYFSGSGTGMGGNTNKCVAYADKALPGSDVSSDDLLIVVMANSANYAGTCYMWPPGNRNTDWGRGFAIAYFPCRYSPSDFQEVLLHECGHGFAKLLDEYDYPGTIPGYEVQDNKSAWSYGWYKNIDYTSNPANVLWAKFITDSRYSRQGIGVYQGAGTYSIGAYRPTQNSIMRHNTGGFNAPSRELIYYKIHKMAYGSNWKYDFEEFVAWDAINGTSAAVARRAAQNAKVAEGVFRPLPPPVVMPHPWGQD